MTEGLNQAAGPTLFLPNLLHLLPDGFGEGEVFVLDVFDRHCPPVTVDFETIS